MKKMNLIALLLASLVLFFVKTSVAQNTTFKLSDYKNPDYFYQTLDLNFGLSNSYDVRKNDNSNDFYNLNSYSFGSQAQAYYSSYANSRKSQSQFSASLSGSFGLNGQHNTYDQTSSETKQNVFSHNESLYFGGLKRFYNDKLCYLEIGGSFSNSYSSNSGKNKSTISGNTSNSTQQSITSFRNTSDLSVLIGKGRIEQVQDARMALYLIEDMHMLNRDKRPASDEDVLELARLITSLKYKRFFDDRLRKIAEITAIDSFMQQKGLVRTTDATYFTSLNDNWDYSNNPVRNSGWRVFTGIEGGFGYNNYKNKMEYIVPAQPTSEQKNINNRLNVFVVAGLDYEKPINLTWQNSASVQAGFGTHYDKSTIKVTDESDVNIYLGETPAMFFTASYGYGYYPNSRTWLTAYWMLSTSYFKEYTGTSNSDKENSTNSFQIYTGPSVQAYYYLSEKLRLNFSFSGHIQTNHDKYIINPTGSDDNQTKTAWNYQLQATLTYSLF
jgi:hypothetical protein